MTPPNSYLPLVHGGDLGVARALFPDAPEPFVDLSTAINPHPYPTSDIGLEDFSRLPERRDLERLAEHAAIRYGAPSAENVVAAPGGQILVSLVAEQTSKGRAAILEPTYAEHARVAALTGFEVSGVTDLAALGEAELAIAVNPNNPDGRSLSKEDLLAVADRQRACEGVLLVDEAFADVGPPGMSLCSVVDREAHIVVLRSFGKFFGLAGVRLSFAITGRVLAPRLRAQLGPWPVSGPAVALGSAALQDEAWIAETKTLLKTATLRLDGLLQHAGLMKIGGTSLFSLVHSPDAQEIFARLGKAGILVRRFDEQPDWLRFGIPGPEDAWTRLENALSA